MDRAVSEVLELNLALGRLCVGAIGLAVTVTAALLDPRPDLSVPARKSNALYTWWW